jgi:hypothetical protein
MGKTVLKITTILSAAALLTIAGAASPTNAATVTYSNQVTFASQLASSVTDDYENPGYSFAQNDAQMSAVLGETSYTATGFQNIDLVPNISGDHYYCAGCNGSFQLGLGTTSVSKGGGVFGAGFDLIGNTNYDAMVNFADGTSTLYTLPTSPFVQRIAFWGITSDLGIASIYLGHGGQPAQDGNTGIDNLQIGSAPAGAVPEPAAWALMLVGFGALGGVLRQSRRARIPGAAV